MSSICCKKYIICVKLKDKLWDETCWCLLKFSETPPETATVSGKYKIVFQARLRVNNVLKDYWYKFTRKWLTGLGWVGLTSQVIDRMDETSGFDRQSSNGVTMHCQLFTYPSM